MIETAGPSGPAVLVARPRAKDGLGSPVGTPPFYRVAEIHFPSMAALEACAASEGGQQTLAHARSISTGGTPIFSIAEEETFTFAQTASA